VRTLELVAIKVESIVSGSKLLKNESSIYQYLNNQVGVPNVRWCGKDEFNYFMVLDLLGDSLESLLKKNGSFSLKLVLQIGFHVLSLIKMLHESGFIHRDIKPDNFLLGLGEKSRQTHVIDFGFCKQFKKNGVHILNKKTSNLIGSPSFASVYAHELNELSRRDDLISMGYMLLYLYKGSLPWQLEINMEKMKTIKIQTQESLSTDIPKELLNYLRDVNNLAFDEEPKYDKLLNHFQIYSL
jgi:serine/threonine protein kinase